LRTLHSTVRESTFMAFFKFRSKGPQGNEARGAAAAAPAESVESMRRRARHRLLGAAVLVLLGVIGFPLLFDTQPRPVAVDIPIEIPDRNKTKPLAVPAPPATTTSNAGSAAEGAAPRTPSSGGMITERADGTEIVATAPAASPAPAAAPPAPKPEPRPDPKPESKPEPKPEPKPEVRREPKPEPSRTAEPKPEAKPAQPKPAARDDGARALALLEGKPAAKPAEAKPADRPSADKPADAAGRFVVQVGAFADADKAKETRQKLERAGLKTYTHVAKTADGERTRVRVGPFGSKAEADKAAERIKGLALPASVLTL
jgi:DedD protein